MSYLSSVADALRAVATREWWNELGEASARQALHVALPVLLAIQVSGVVNGDALKTALVAILGGEIVVIGRRLLALQAPAGSGLVVDYTFRAVSTFAGSVLGSVLAVDAFNVLNAPWGSILTTAAGAVAVALLHGATDAPASRAREESLTVLSGDYIGGYSEVTNTGVPSQGTASRTLEDALASTLLSGPNVALDQPIGDPFAQDADGEWIDPGPDGDPTTDDIGDRGVGSHYPDIDGPAVR